MKKLQIKLTPKQKKEAEVLEAELKARARRGELCGILAQLNLQSGAVECVILDAETSKGIAALIQQRGFDTRERAADGAASALVEATREMEW